MEITDIRQTLKALKVQGESKVSLRTLERGEDFVTFSSHALELQQYVEHLKSMPPISSIEMATISSSIERSIAEQILLREII